VSGARQGFGLIEVIVAMIILAVGVLSMGASTGYILSQIRASELRTARMVAVQDVVEQLRGTGWEDLTTRCAGHTFEAGSYEVTCHTEVFPNLARIQVISKGPAFRGGRVAHAVQDTMVISIARPL
jgi:prepilin-type N-terminal cleavage/methylation domain-containing protein